MKKGTRNLLLGLGAACAAGISLIGARKVNEKLCERSNEKTRLKEATEIGHVRNVNVEVLQLNGVSGLFIEADGSYFAFLESIENEKATERLLNDLLKERGIKKEEFKGIVVASYHSEMNDILDSENPELVNMDEGSILHNKPIFLPSDSRSVDFGIPIKVGRAVMISAGLASTGPMVFPVGLSGRITKQGLIMNIADRGMVLFMVDNGQDLIPVIQQLFAFTNEFQEVVLLHDESYNKSLGRRILHGTVDFIGASWNRIKMQVGRPIMDSSLNEKKNVLRELIKSKVVLCGNYGVTTTMEFKELFGENLEQKKFGEHFRMN